MHLKVIIMLNELLEYSQFTGLIEGDSVSPAGMLLLLGRLANDPHWCKEADRRARAAAMVETILDIAEAHGFTGTREFQALLGDNVVSARSVDLAEDAAAAAGREIFDALYRPMHVREAARQVLRRHGVNSRRGPLAR
ncbi:hypothetical protein ACT80S_00145 [Ramlibacter sp. MAHUQ-53]|uniref:hypothetical protein n=1 Tax=unclassified Ramlibacter TaxID=2617605 RepID=UPI00363A26AF